MKKALSLVGVVLLSLSAAFGLNIGSTGQVSVASSATQIIARSVGQARQAILITNTSGSTPVYIGTSSVTTSTGAYLGPSQSLTIPVNCDVWGIVSSTSVTVTFVEVVQ